MEVESALVDHPAVAEAAVVGRAHDLKGQALAAFVTLKEGNQASAGLKDDLKAHVIQKIGAIARPDDIFFSADLTTSHASSTETTRTSPRLLSSPSSMSEVIPTTPPPAVSGGDLEVQTGAWLALAGSAILVAGAFMSVARMSLSIEQREPPPPRADPDTETVMLVPDRPA